MARTPDAIGPLACEAHVISFTSKKCNIDDLCGRSDKVNWLPWSFFQKAERTQLDKLCFCLKSGSGSFRNTELLFYKKHTYFARNPKKHVVLSYGTQSEFPLSEKKCAQSFFSFCSPFHKMQNKLTGENKSRQEMSKLVDFVAIKM